MSAPAVPEALRHLDAIMGDAPPALFLDFDGTLSPIVDDPAAARPAPGVVETVTDLARRLPVAIVSGREIDDLRSRLPIPGIWLAGAHGFEIRGPDGSGHAPPVDPARLRALEAVRDELRTAVRSLPGCTLEEKRRSVAVHVRRAQAEVARRALALARELSRRPGLRGTPGRAVLEILPDEPWHKGRSVQWLCARAPFAGRRPIYLGDDVTDEDAFRAIRDRGIGVLVAEQPRETAARYRLADPAAARDFLEALARSSG